MHIQYTATRSVIGAHTSGEVYDLVLGASIIDPQRRPHVSENRSLDGTTETDFQRIDREWEFETDLLNLSGNPTLAEFDEFLDSVAGGETFTFDPYATSAGSPVSPKTVRMVPGRYRPRRRGTTDFFTYRLRVREV